MRKAGVKASLGVNGCCRSCIWFEHDEWNGVPVIWFYSGQGNKIAYDENGMVKSHKAIYLNHNGDQFPDEIRACVAILENAGLDASWSGDSNKCVEVIFS
jgi:hypothetical protein